MYQSEAFLYMSTDINELSKIIETQEHNFKLIDHKLNCIYELLKKIQDPYKSKLEDYHRE